MGPPCGGGDSLAESSGSHFLGVGGDSLAESSGSHFLGGGGNSLAESSGSHSSRTVTVKF